MRCHVIRRPSVQDYLNQWRNGGGGGIISCVPRSDDELGICVMVITTHGDTDTAIDNIQVHVIQPQSNSDVHVHDIEDTLPLKDISNEIANLQKQNEP